MPRLLIPPGLLRAARRHAAAVYPEECCGLLVGRRLAAGEVRVTRVESCDNAAGVARGARFAIAPERLFAVWRAARARRDEVVGSYHSHPRSPAVPSERDRREGWPGASHLIVSLADGSPVAVRSWRLAPDGTGFVEERVELDAVEDRR